MAQIASGYDVISPNSESILIP